MTGVLNMAQKYAFIHLPKCAGSSISHVLMKNDQARDFREFPELVDIVRADAGSGPTHIENAGHARACDLQKFLGRDVYSQFEVFTVVRNPWSRLVSRYHFQRHILREKLPQHLRGSFNDFVFWACKSRPSTQFERVSDKCGEILVKDVLRFENLKEDFSMYTERVLGCPFELPMMNISPVSSHGVKYSKAAISAVQTAYQRDFANFQYQSQPPDDLVL